MQCHAVYMFIKSFDDLLFTRLETWSENNVQLTDALVLKYALDMWVQWSD